MHPPYYPRLQSLISTYITFVPSILDLNLEKHYNMYNMIFIQMLYNSSNF